MKKFFNIFFVVLGVIFTIILLFGVYFFITDPLNLKPLFFGGQTKTIDNTDTQDPAQDSNSSLSESQQKALQTFGIDPADVPSQFTPEQEACFEAKLGTTRVAEIKAGDAPTATDYFTAKDCI